MKTAYKEERLTLSIAETAELLGLSLSNVYDLANRGLIPARRLRGRWLVSRRLLQEWVDEVPRPEGRL